MINLTRKELKYVLGIFKLLRTGLKSNADFPILVELQTVNRCNAKCIMCPYSYTTATKELQKIDDKLFDKILRQLSVEKKFNTLILSFQNEPLIDTDLINKAKKFKRIMPYKNLEIVTNGSLINKNILPKLYQYFDRVSISINANTKETYENIMNGLGWDSIMENLDLISSKKEWINKTVLRFIKQDKNIQEFKEFKKFWNKKGFSVFSFDVNSRSNSLIDYENLKIARNIYKIFSENILKIIGKLTLPFCTVPLISFYIRASGDVVLCFNDYTDNNILGNINKNTIREIFNSEIYKQIRHNMSNGKKLNNDLCNKCDLYKKGIWLTI